jgi:peptidylprolyl isomerase
MRYWLLGGWGLLAATLAGCDTDQIQVVPVTPPGAVIPRPTPEGDDVAEAQGEMAATSVRNTTRADAAPLADPTPVGQPVTLENGLKYETVKEGTGEVLKPGHVGVLHYTGTLDDGTVFDSSKKSGKPAEFSFGLGGLITGWQVGIPGMKVGETRKLSIPPALGYKDKDHGDIPANSTLHFEVELVGVK